MFFKGQDSHLFHFASRFGDSYRLALLIYETVRMAGRKVAVTVGKPILPQEFDHLRDLRLLTEFLREETLKLSLH